MRGAREVSRLRFSHDTIAPLAERTATHPFMREVPREYLPFLAENALEVTFVPEQIVFGTGDPCEQILPARIGAVQLELSRFASKHGGARLLPSFPR